MRIDYQLAGTFADVVKHAGGESLAVDVYEQLRNDIFDRRLAPGARLKPMELGKRFGVSISVMREALGLLAAKDLVTIERNRGFHVTTLSAQTLHSLIETRKIVEGSGLRLSIERGSVAWEAEVLAAHHRLASVPTSSPEDADEHYKSWTDAHVEFHRTLLEACGNPVLLNVCLRLSDSAELYRAWSHLLPSAPKRDIGREHKELMEAALAHDADLAVARFEAHVERTEENVLSLDAEAPPRTRSAKAS